MQVPFFGTESVTGDSTRLDGLRPWMPTPLPREWPAALLARSPCCPRRRPATGTAVGGKVADIVGCQATFSQLTDPILLRLQAAAMSSGGGVGCLPSLLGGSMSDAAVCPEPAGHRPVGLGEGQPGAAASSLHSREGTGGQDSTWGFPAPFPSAAGWWISVPAESTWDRQVMFTLSPG